MTIAILEPNKCKTDLINNRPISMSNTMSKLLQKMVNKRLTWYSQSKYTKQRAECIKETIKYNGCINIFKL